MDSSLLSGLSHFTENKVKQELWQKEPFANTAGWIQCESCSAQPGRNRPALTPLLPCLRETGSGQLWGGLCEVVGTKLHLCPLAPACLHSPSRLVGRQFPAYMLVMSGFSQVPGLKTRQWCETSVSREIINSQLLSPSVRCCVMVPRAMETLRGINNVRYYLMWWAWQAKATPSR